jgi:hypothetical protein
VVVSYLMVVVAACFLNRLRSKMFCAERAVGAEGRAELKAENMFIPVGLMDPNAGFDWPDAARTGGVV